MGTQVSFPGLGIEMNISETAFRIGGLDVKWYGVVIGVGLALAFIFAFRKSATFGIDGDHFLDVIIIGVVAGVIGARLYYVVFSLDEFDTFWDIFNIRNGGMAFYGAVIFGVGSAIFTCRWRNVKLLPAVDIAAYGFLIGQGIGRWGNFFNQEAFGGNTTLPWGMISQKTTYYLSRNAAALAERGMVVDPYAPVHPTFLYESLWCGLGFLLLYLYMNRRKFDGEIFLMYIAWNGFGRAFIEGLRTDSLYIGNTSLRISQILALVGSLAAILVILYVRKKIKDAEDESYLKPYGMTPEGKEALLALASERELAAKEKLDKKALKDIAQEAEEEKEKDDKAKKEKTADKDSKKKDAAEAESKDDKKSETKKKAETKKDTDKDKKQSKSDTDKKTEDKDSKKPAEKTGKKADDSSKKDSASKAKSEDKKKDTKKPADKADAGSKKESASKPKSETAKKETKKSTDKADAGSKKESASKAKNETEKKETKKSADKADAGSKKESTSKAKNEAEKKEDAGKKTDATAKKTGSTTKKTSDASAKSKKTDGDKSKKTEDQTAKDTQKPRAEKSKKKEEKKPEEK